MILKKVYSPFFIVIAIAFLIMQSCKNKPLDRNDPSLKKYYSLIDTAESKLNTKEFDSSFYYYNQASLHCDKNDFDRIVYPQIEMAKIQMKQCDFVGCELTATDAYKYCKNPVYLANIYSILGRNYVEQYDFKNAIKYHNKSYSLQTRALDKIITKNNIGLIYLESENFRKAYSVFYPLIFEDSLKADKKIYAKVLDNLGYTCFKLKDPKAIEFLNKSVKIRDSLEENYESIASNVHLSEYYQDINSSLARDYAIKAYQFATIEDSPDDRIEALKFLITSSDPQVAKQLALKQISLSDSIYKVRAKYKVQFAKIKYDTQEIVKENNKYKRQLKWLFLILGCIIAIASAMYYVIKSKNKLKLQKVTYETETRISKKLHDELANDVFNAMTFAETQDLQNSDKKEFLLDNLDTIYARTRNIAKENSDIETGEEFPMYLQGMISSYITNEVNVITQNSNAINWSKVKKETKIAIYRVVQELLVNMKKHSQCSIAIIGFETKNNHMEITYSDNGIGTSEMLKFKNGLQNAENRILAINGTLTFETESGKGFKAKIIFSK